MRLRTIGFVCAMMGAVAVSFADDPALPDGYAPLDWIESTGGQYIDTGVNAGANTTIDMSFGHCVYIEESTLFGKDVWDPQGWLFIMQSDHFRFFGTQGSDAALWNLIGKDLTEQRDYRFTLGTDDKARMFDASGTELCALATDRSTDSNHSLWLFKCNNPYGKPGGKFRLYSAKIGTDEGETLRDFVPARRMVDRAVGLYDRVTKSFFANAGTGAFLASDERYVFLDWIESTGTQYINTGVDAGANTTIDMSFGHCVYVQSSTLFGKDVWGPQGWLFVMQNEYFRFFGNTGTSGAAWNLADKDSTGQRDYRFTLGADNTARMFDADDNELCALATDRSTASNHPLWLFKNATKLGSPGRFRLYSAKIGTDAGETLRDFVPARRVSDSAIGLYDRVTKCFFANAGTGAFLASTSGDPVTAIWTGAGDGTNILQEANWRCYNADGQTMADALPGPNTVVRMTDVAMASVSAGTVWPYGKVVIGAQDHPLTEWGRIGYGVYRYKDKDMPNYNFVNIPLADYEWKGAQSGIDAQLDDYNTAWMNSNLKQSQLRFDGWVYVDDTKAGTWSILQCFDDYFYFTLDGQMLAQNLTFRYATNFTAQVSSGWHRFSIICGDCWGGYGSLRWAGKTWSGPGLSHGPMTITAGESTFKFSELPGGSGENKITLAYDCDWRGLGIIDLGNAQKIDLAGHRLYVAGFTGDGRLGPEITDSVGGGELHLDNASDWANSTVRISGGLKLFKEGRGTFTSSFHDQTYSGGTEVAEGTFKCGALESFGSREGTVTVRSGATLNLDGWGNAGGRKYVLDGGTIRSDVMRAYRDTTWLDDVTLTADSFMAGRDFGFHQVNGEAHLDLGGNTLSINSTAAGREFVFCSLVATGGGRIAVNGVGDLGYYNVSFSPDIVLEQGVRMVCYSHARPTWQDVLGGYDASGYTLDDSCETNMCAQIAGRFKPGANFHVCKLLDGATLDLSAFSEPWPCTGLTEGVTCGFAENAVIKVDVGERKLKNGDCVLRWADGVRPSGTRFEFVSSAKGGKLACALDGLYYYGGLIVVVR